MVLLSFNENKQYCASLDAWSNGRCLLISMIQYNSSKTDLYQFDPRLSWTDYHERSLYFLVDRIH